MSIGAAGLHGRAGRFGQIDRGRAVRPEPAAPVHRAGRSRAHGAASGKGSPPASTPGQQVAAGSRRPAAPRVARVAVGRELQYAARARDLEAGLERRTRRAPRRAAVADRAVSWVSVTCAATLTGLMPSTVGGFCTAYTLMTSPHSHRAWSRSWIIRSMITPPEWATSRYHPAPAGDDAWRKNRATATSPIRPAWIASYAALYAGKYRTTWAGYSRTPAGRRGVDDLVRVGRRQRQRLLADHVLARLDRGQRDLLVRRRRGDDVDELDLREAARPASARPPARTARRAPSAPSSECTRTRAPSAFHAATWTWAMLPAPIRPTVRPANSSDM